MKPEFKDLKLDDKVLVTKLLRQNGDGADGDISCERQFATIFSWRMAYPVRFAQIGEGIVFHYTWNDECLFMVKQPDLIAFEQSIQILIDNCDKGKIRLINMTKTQADFLQKKYCADVSFDINYSDYIYNADNFRTYSGKKLHSKKNKLNRFLSLYGDNYSCKPITPVVINDCLTLLDEWKNNNDSDDKEIRFELIAAEQLLVHYFELDLIGCCLYIDDKPIGFTIGEPLYVSSDNSTLVVHCEKAAYDYDGAYPALAHFFAVMLPEFKFINREDDCGDEGLRQSKNSYAPLFLLHKYSAVIDKSYLRNLK